MDRFIYRLTAALYTSTRVNTIILKYKNKSWVVCLASLILFSLQGWAQQSKPTQEELAAYYPKKFISKIELLAGPSLSFLRGSLYVDNNEITTRSLKQGYTFGIAFTNPLKKNLDLSASVLFEKKGSISTFNSTYFDQGSQSMKSGKVENDFAYDYISVPLIIEYSFGKRNSLKFGAGLFTSYLLKQTMKIFRTPQGPGGIEDQTDLNSHLDFGAALKLGYEIPIS